MKLLVVQESDWMRKGPHQQHHILERMSAYSDEVRVIDFEVGWKSNERRQVLSRRRIFHHVSKVQDDSTVQVIRPTLARIPGLDMASLLMFHGLEIRHQLATFHPDVVIGLGIANGVVAIESASKYSVPFVYFLLDELHTLVPYSFMKPIAHALFRRAIRKASGIIVINDRLRDFAIGQGADPETTYVVKSGVDADLFNPDVKGHPLRKRLGLARTDFVLLHMGGMFSFSGMREVAKGLAEVRRESPEIKLLIVGWGRTPDVEDDLREVLKKYRLENQVIFAGRQPYQEMPSFVAAADLCLFVPYENEVTRNIVPIRFYEYMMGGRPVLATRLPGVVREFGENHGVFYVNNPGEVVGELRDLLARDVDFEVEGTKAAEFVRDYTWERVVEQFRERIDQIRNN